MDDFSYDFGEAFGQRLATFDDVKVFLSNEMGIKEPDLSIIMDNLYPSVETLSAELIAKYENVKLH